jgi:hypothetical protein
LVMSTQPANAVSPSRSVGVVLDRRRHEALVVLVAVALSAIAFRHLRDWFEFGRDHPFDTDFGLYYAFAKVGLQHGLGHLYDLRAQHEAYASIGPLHWFELPYPPPVAWLVAPFTALPLAAAYWVWSVLIAGALLMTCVIVGPSSKWQKLAVLGVFLWPQCVISAVSLGQVIVFQMLGVAACWWFVKKDRPVAAGIALTPIALHPQGLFLLPFVLLTAGQKRLFATWALAMLAVAGACVIALGPDGVDAYAHRLAAARNSPEAFAVDPRFAVPLWAAQYGIPVLLVQVVVALFALVSGWRLRYSPIELPIIVGIICSLLATPFLHSQDLALLVLALCLLPHARLPLWHYALGLAVYASLVAAPHLSVYGRALGGLPVIGLEVVWLLGLWASASHHRPGQVPTARPSFARSW